MNKYGAMKVTIDGITFDSKKEASRYCELRLLERAGEIRDLKRQVEYELIPAQYETYERYSKQGKRLKDGIKLIERRCCYVADFVYTDVKTGIIEVEDTKGMRTKEYIIKRKLMRHIYNITIKEV